MDSLFANLYTALAARINTNVPAIRGVYPELSQTENYNGTPALWPAVFIDFNNLTFSELTGLIQSGSGEIQFRFAYRVTALSGIIFLDTNTALSYYEAELKLHQTLQGWTNGSIAPLTRLKVSTEVRDGAFRVRVLTYSLNFNEYPVVPVTRDIKTPPLVLLP
jgi:hypothetical protein